MQIARLHEIPWQKITLGKGTEELMGLLFVSEQFENSKLETPSWSRQG